MIFDLEVVDLMPSVRSHCPYLGLLLALKRVCVLLPLLCWVDLTHAQTASKESLITAYVYQLSDAVQWQNVDNVNALSLSYLGSSETLLAELQNLQSRRIGGLAVTVAQIADIQTAVDRSNIIVVDELFGARLPYLFEQLARRPVLVITINAADQKLTHINLLSSGNRITFELNRYTLAYNNLPVDIDVMVLGGREVDIALLLKELQQSVALKEGQLEQVNAVIATQQSTIDKQLSDIESTKGNLNRLRQQLASEQQEKSRLEAQSAQLNADVLSVQQRLEERNLALEQREASLNSQQQLISRNEQLIARQQQEIQAQNDQLRSSEQLLSSQSDTIKEQTEQIQQSDELITTQSAVIFVIVVLLLLILLVFMAFMRRSHKLRVTHQALLDTKDQLVESEKMASLGFLVAGVAHEMNTPLGIVITAVTFLESQITEFERKITSERPSKRELLETLNSSKETIELIRSNQMRAANLIARFKELSSDELLKEPKFITVKSVLEDAYHFHLSPEEKELLELEVICQDDLSVFCNATALTNVCTQMMSNAVVHGRISVQNKVEMRIECLSDSGNLKLSFSNPGEPLDENQVKQLFEPFYTTKRHQGLMGLGLHICYNIVHNHLNGSVKLDSQHKDICFVVTLPTHTT